jgi:hypothetical protein
MACALDTRQNDRYGSEAAALLATTLSIWTECTVSTISVENGYSM